MLLGLSHAGEDRGTVAINIIFLGHGDTVPLDGAMLRPRPNILAPINPINAPIPNGSDVFFPDSCLEVIEST